MEKEELLEFHKNNWYKTASIDFEDIEPHISNFKKVKEKFFIAEQLPVQT